MTNRAFAIAIAVVTLVGLGVRVALCPYLGVHIDEPESIIAAQMVAEHGVPVFPSGLLFLQAATVSYLLAPLVHLGYGIDQIAVLRLVSAVIGAAAVPVAGIIARRASASGLVGVAAAALLAIDPASLQWSANIRPYAALELLSLLFAWAVLDMAAGSRRAAAVCVALFTIGTFTHIGIAMIWPAVVIAGVATYGKEVPRLAVVTLAVALLGPVAFFLVNHDFGVTSAGSKDHGDVPSFVGNHLIDPERAQDPDFSSWRNLYNGHGDVETALILIALSIVLGRWLLGDPETRERRFATAVILACAILPVSIVSAITNEPQSRYLLHAHPFGLMALPIAGFGLWTATSGPQTARRVVAVLVFGGAAFATTAQAYWRVTHRSVDPVDYEPPLKYVAAHHVAGEPVYVAMPPIAWLLGSDDPQASFSRADMVFLAGPPSSARASRYTRERDGKTVDFWGGFPAITSTTELCEALLAHPGAWVVVDRKRLEGRFAYDGPFATVIDGSGAPVWNQPNGARVLKVEDRASWTPDALRLCTSENDPDAAPPPDPDGSLPGGGSP